MRCDDIAAEILSLGSQGSDSVMYRTTWVLVWGEDERSFGRNGICGSGGTLT